MSMIQHEGNNNSVIHTSCSYTGSSRCAHKAWSCSIEEHLRYLSQHSTMALTLYGIWISDKLRLGKMLSLISAPPFQTFSDHGSGHSEMLLATVARVLGDRLCLLGATDTWIILESAYRHDLGMYIELRDIQDALHNTRFIRQLDECLYDDNEDMRNAAHTVKSQLDELRQRYMDFEETPKLQADLSRYFMMILARYFRVGHAERSKKILVGEMESSIDQPVPMRLWRTVADICAGHGKKKDDTLKRPHKEMGLDNDVAHPRLIQLLLRLADMLDLDNNRFNNYQLSQWGVDVIPLDSQAHIQKHKSLEHLHVDTHVVSLKARMDYANSRRRKIDMIMRDETYYQKIWEKSEQFKHRKLSANEIAYELKNNGHELVRKMQELEDQRKYEYKLSRIKRAASRLVRKYIDETREELEFLAVNWQIIVPEGFHGSAPKFDDVNSEIWWKAKKLDEEIVDLKYSISHRRASEIMQGASLYGDSEYAETPLHVTYYHRLLFLREFVQNGMDAMKLQLFRNILENRYGTYNKLTTTDTTKWNIFDVLDITSALSKYAVVIKVHIRLSDYTLIFQIIDNGCGIDKETMKLMKEVGAKKPHYVLEEINRMPDWLRPNGSFGIGMQSVYAVTDHFIGVSQSYSDLKKHEMMFEYDSDGGSLFAEELVKGDVSDENRYREYGYGTMFMIEIPCSKVIENHIFNGVTPFDYDIDSVFNDINNRISTFLGKDLFPVKLKFFVDEVEVHNASHQEYESAFKKIYGMYLAKNNDDMEKGVCVENSHGVTCFVSKDKESKRNIILTYNKEHGILMEIMFNGNQRTKYYYRGLYVPEIEDTLLMRYPGCTLIVQHWAGNAEDMLLVSRNKLATAAKSYVYKIITETADIALGLYIDYLCSLDAGIFPFEDNEPTAFAEAMFNYRIRMTNPTVITNCNLSKCDKLYRVLDKQGWLTGKHRGLRIMGSAVEYGDIDDSEVYSKSFVDLWYIQSNIKYRGGNLIAFEIPDMLVSEESLREGSFILFDDHINTLFSRHTRIFVKQLQLVYLSKNKTPYWIYRLSDTITDTIKASEETQTKFTIGALEHGVSNDDISNNTEIYPFAAILKGRPILPGFESYKGLNVSRLPRKNNPNDENSIFYHLGNYFIWPFSYEQIERIKEWVSLIHQHNNKEEIDELSLANIDTLKKCKEINDALSKDNAAYNTLISYVAENLTSNTSAHITDYQNSSYQQKCQMEEAIRNRYENIIASKLWPILYKWLIEPLG